MALVIEHIVTAVVFFESVESALFLIYSHYCVDEIKLLVCERAWVRGRLTQTCREIININYALYQ